ncbi:putative serine/threonine-protein kinase [Hordeum vulgare]|nr:putative serine/threonine-protein kinase [Hordeum vulgare]
MAQDMALSVAGDCVLPPVTPSSPANAEPEPKPIERYSWTGVVHEWVSAPAVWVGTTLAQEAAYLEHWPQRRLAEERRHGEYLEMLERGAEEEQREAEEEAR